MSSESWYLPESAKDAVDCLDDLAAVVDFFQDTLPRKSEEEYSLSESGASGYGFLLMFVRDTLVRSSIVIHNELKGVK